MHDCLKKKYNKNPDEDLSLDDLKDIVTNKRDVAHKCYTKYIGDINSHGLVLLHGPIRFDDLDGRIYPDCELSHHYNDFYYRRGFHRHFRKRNQTFFGTLLFGDTSIKPDNNPVNFPQQFKEKLVHVHAVQVPHHGSSKNWNLEAFVALNIGSNLPFWGNNITAVCNFGYGNRYGHPSHDVLNDLHSIIFLNSQFSRLNICYDIF